MGLINGWHGEPEPARKNKIVLVHITFSLELLTASQVEISPLSCHSRRIPKTYVVDIKSNHSK